MKDSDIIHQVANQDKEQLSYQSKMKMLVKSTISCINPE